MQVSFAPGPDDFNDSLAAPVINRSQHAPRPPPSKNSNDVLSNLQTQQIKQLKDQTQQYKSPTKKNQELVEEIQYFQNARTSSLEYKPTREFSYDAEAEIELNSPSRPFIVGSAEILRQKAINVYQSSSFASPKPKPMLRCRSIKPTISKQGPSIRSVPLSDDQWILSEKEKQHTRLIEGDVGFGKSLNEGNFPTSIEDVTRYPQKPQTMGVLEDEAWRDSLGLTRPLPGSIDYSQDIHSKHKTCLTGNEMALAKKTLIISDYKDMLNNELYELSIAEKEKKDYVIKMKEEQQKALLIESGQINGQNTTTPGGQTNSVVNNNNNNNTASGTTSISKLSQNIQKRQSNISKIKKSLKSEIKGKRFRGELSSFQSNTQRGSFLNEILQSNYHGDISHLIELENNDKQRQSSSSINHQNTHNNQKQQKMPMKHESASFMSRTGRVPIYGDAGGNNIMVTRSLPKSEKWNPNGSMEVSKLKLKSISNDTMSHHEGGGGMNGNISSDNSLHEGTNSIGFSSLISALSFGDDDGVGNDPMDIDELVALRSQRRNAMQARLVAEEAAKMPTVLSDWLVRYKVESLKSSLASQFGINTMSDIIEADEKKMDWMLYTVPKGMRARFSNMVSEIKHKDDLSFALSEATGSASFGVEKKRSTNTSLASSSNHHTNQSKNSNRARPSLKSLSKKISRSQSFLNNSKNNNQSLKSNGSINGSYDNRSVHSKGSLSSSTISEHSCTIINSRHESESVKEYSGDEDDEDNDNDNEDKNNKKDDDSSDDENDKMAMKMRTRKEYNSDTDSDDESRIHDDKDKKSISSHKSNDNSDENNSDLNSNSDDSDGSDDDDSDRGRGDGDDDDDDSSDSSQDEDLLRLYETNELIRQRSEQRMSLDRNNSIRNNPRNNNTQAVSLSRLRRNSNISLTSSINKNSTNNDNGNVTNRRGSNGTILSPVPIDKFGRKGPSSLSISKILQPNISPSQLLNYNKELMLNSNASNDMNSSRKSRRVGVGGDQLGQLKSKTLSETLKQEISDERKGRLLYNSTPLTLSHMDKTMYESKNRILHYEDDDDKDDFTMNVSGGGAVSSFKAGERRELFTTKDKILTANLEYDVENKSIEVKSPWKASSSFTTRERPPLFIAQTGSDFNYGAKFKPPVLHFIEENPHTKSNVSESCNSSER